MTILYSVLHALVDGVCALAMFGTFIPREYGYFSILLYNFCAFALQMPLGVALDMLNGKDRKKKTDFALFTAVVGVVCTIVGSVAHPIVLGIGNALFHVGGGVGTIRGNDPGNANECCDESGGKIGNAENGRLGAVRGDSGGSGRSGYGTGGRRNSLEVRLGIFVAPGALGLYLGTLLAQNGAWKTWRWAVSAFMLLLCGGMIGIRARQHMRYVRKPCAGETSQIEKPTHDVYSASQEHVSIQTLQEIIDTQPLRENTHVPYTRCKQETLRLTACCLFVVILRSYIGMAVSFSWKSGVLLGFLSVLVIAGGKMAGGFAAAQKGAFPTAAVSLIAAAVCYLFSGVMPVGLAALFFFNMTMPITLYWMVRAFPQMPGFAFGCLTFALFLGFVPSYLGVPSILAENVIGCAGSILSMLFLAVGIGEIRDNGKEAA